MKKRLLVIFPLIGLFLWMCGNGSITYVAAKSLQEEKIGCEDVDHKMEEDIKSVAEILTQDDYTILTNRINELSSSTDALKAEKDLIEQAVCVDMVNDKMELRAQINTYHSLLVYALELVEKEDIQFEEIEMELDNQENYIQLQGLLKDSDREVHIDYYYSVGAPSAYFGHQVQIEEEKLKQMEDREDRPLSLVSTMTSGLSTSAYQLIQNPIEKFIVMSDHYLSDKKQKEYELFQKEAVIPSMTYDLEFSVIIGDLNKWEQLQLAEYYPTTSTYMIVDHVQEVRHEIPEYWYPKEAIEKEDWNEVVAYYEKHLEDMIDYDQELYEYIMSNDLPPSESVEDLLERVKQEKGPPKTNKSK